MKSRLRTARSRLQQEMLGMVEEAVQDRAPRDDFAESVFRLLNLYPAQGYQYSR